MLVNSSTILRLFFQLAGWGFTSRKPILIWEDLNRKKIIIINLEILIFYYYVLVYKSLYMRPFLLVSSNAIPRFFFLLNRLNLASRRFLFNLGGNPKNFLFPEKSFVVFNIYAGIWGLCAFLAVEVEYFLLWGILFFLSAGWDLAFRRPFFNLGGFPKLFCFGRGPFPKILCSFNIYASTWGLCAFFVNKVEYFLLWGILFFLSTGWDLAFRRSLS